jgi:phage terminase large subunit GpA-like protein
MERKTSYSELLTDPRWQKKRLEILNRDDFTCQMCGDKETTLHVHHNWYEKEKKPWEYKNKDLITLCKHCHELITPFQGDVETSRKIIHKITMDGGALYFLAWPWDITLLYKTERGQIFNVGYLLEKDIYKLQETLQKWQRDLQTQENIESPS